MDNLKSTYREGEETTKETMRKADGDESLADKIGNAGDDLRKEAGNLGDDLKSGANDMGNDARSNTRGDDLDDRVGNAGDDLRGDQRGVLSSRLSEPHAPGSAGGAFLSAGRPAAPAPLLKRPVIPRRRPSALGSPLQG